MAKIPSLLGDGISRLPRLGASTRWRGGAMESSTYDQEQDPNYWRERAQEPAVIENPFVGGGEFAPDSNLSDEEKQFVLDMMRSDAASLGGQTLPSGLQVSDSSGLGAAMAAKLYGHTLEPTPLAAPSSDKRRRFMAEISQEKELLDSLMYDPRSPVGPEERTRVYEQFFNDASRRANLLHMPSVSSSMEAAQNAESPEMMTARQVDAYRATYGDGVGDMIASSLSSDMDPRTRQAVIASIIDNDARRKKAQADAEKVELERQKQEEKYRAEVRKEALKRADMYFARLRGEDINMMELDDEQQTAALEFTKKRADQELRVLKYTDPDAYDAIIQAGSPQASSVPGNADQSLNQRQSLEGATIAQVLNNQGHSAVYVATREDMLKNIPSLGKIYVLPGPRVVEYIGEGQFREIEDWENF